MIYPMMFKLHHSILVEECYKPKRERRPPPSPPSPPPSRSVLGHLWTDFHKICRDYVLGKKLRARKELDM